MSRDLYPALSGAVGAWNSLEQIANNLANVSTTGYRAQRSAFSVTGPDGHPLGQAYAKTRPAAVDERDGAVVRDDVSTHLALQGPGYFLVGSDGDAPTVTRDGRFTLDAARRLVDAQGLPVQGDGGAIEIPEGETFTVAPDGAVTASESGLVGQLRIVLPDGLRALGGNKLEAVGGLRQGTAQVVQGALEASNVDPMSAMVDLVQASRIFDAFQKAMQASDELDGRLNQMGGR
ncbi:MAG: flagellar hook-basal body protein [Myxococcota bacterium]